MRKLIGVMALLVALVACKKAEPQLKLEDLPAGEATRGAALFEQGVRGATACSKCHRTDSVDQAGPGLQGIGGRAGQRVDGQNATEYLFESILRPARYLVTGFSNLMPSDYATKLSAQQVADLIAYLLTL
jgi:cytochrome c553